MLIIVQVEEVHRANKKKFESVNKEEYIKFYCGHLNPFSFVSTSSIRLSLFLFSSWLTHSNFSHVSNCFELRNPFYGQILLVSHSGNDSMSTVSSPQTMPRRYMKKGLLNGYSASWQRAVTNFSINPQRTYLNKFIIVNFPRIHLMLMHASES
jgi:hypothetical protein